MRSLFLCLVLVATLLSPGCGDAEGPGAPAGAADGPVVVCTIGMITDIAARVGGERARVEGVIPSGTDPHLFLPGRADIAALSRGDIVFYNGLLLEGRMTDVLVRSAAGGRAVVAVTEALDPTYLLEPPELAGHPDPHVWMDPTAWAAAVVVVRDRLAAFDPGGETVYEANAASVLEQIAELGTYAEQVLATVPAERRVLVTAHDAFNYFGRRFGFEVVGIQGISTDSEAGVRDIERLVTLIVERRIPAVFVESTVAERNVRALVDGARAQGHEVVIGGSLYSDAMGAAGTWEGTYIGMIDHNVTTIARALGGDAPEGGLRAWREARP